MLRADCHRVDLIRGGKGREWRNCVLRADCFRGLDKGWEGKGLGECETFVKKIRSGI